LYHAVTGLIPFADCTDEVALEKQMNGYLADPSILVPQLSPAFCFLLEKCLIKDRSQRYPDWSALQKDIEEVQAGRLPRGPLPEVGTTTLERTAGREQRTVKQIEAMKPQKVRPKNTMPPTPRASPKAPPPIPLRNSRLGPTLLKTLYWALMVGISYGVAFTLLNR